MLSPCLTISTSGKSMVMKHTLLQESQPPTIAFTVLAQLCGPKADETEMGAALFTKNGEGRKFDFLALLVKILFKYLFSYCYHDILILKHDICIDSNFVYPLILLHF